MRLSLLIGALVALTASSVVAVPQLKIHLTDASDYCFILPSSRMTIGASEDGGNGAKSFCTKPRTGQGQLPTGAGAWKNGPNFKKTSSYVQVTGCINTSAYSTLVRNDGGGQYDSNGGAGGRGNPRGSACTGYKSYVEIVEPDSGRICVRCCNDVSKCPLQYDTQGCGKIVPNGNYNGC